MIRFAKVLIPLALGWLVAPLAAAAEAPLDTSFSLLVGFPEKAGAGTGTLVVPGTVIPVEVNEHAIDWVKGETARSAILTKVGDRLKSTFRLASYEVIYSHRVAMTAGEAKELPGPDEESAITVQAKLLGYHDGAASYEVEFFERSAVVASNRLTVQRGQRAVVGGLDGDEAPYYFLVVEPTVDRPPFADLADGITPPRALHKVAPGYPPEAKAAGVEGSVVLRAYIDATGRVRDAEVLKEQPLGLTEAAIEAVRKWVFEPAVKDGAPIEVTYNLTINYRLPKKEEPAKPQG